MATTDERVLTEEEVTKVRFLQRFWTECREPDERGCILVGSGNRYIPTTLGIRAHRLIFAIEKNDNVIPCSDTVVRHTCDRKNCVAPDHLLSGTQRDNIDDAVERGLMLGAGKWGTPNPSAGNGYGDDDLMPLGLWCEMVGRAYQHVWAQWLKHDRIVAHSIDGAWFVRKSTPKPENKKRRSSH